MSRRRIHQRLIASFAALVMAFAALAPALASAMGRSTPVMWVELCSSQGVKRVAVDVSSAALTAPVTTSSADDSSDPVAPGVTNGEHCPFCHLHSSALHLPPVTPLARVPAAQSSAAYPSRFYDAPRPSHAWAPAHSRAPPSR